MSDQEIQQLESQFPSLAGRAFADARRETLEAGQSVMESEGKYLYRVFPDGKKEVVKEIAPPISVQPGTIFTIR